MHPTTFEYLKPTDDQIKIMNKLREASRQYVETLSQYMPDGPDKTYAIRKAREIAMWANVAVTRQADGTPRE